MANIAAIKHSRRSANLARARSKRREGAVRILRLRPPRPTHGPPAVTNRRTQAPARAAGMEQLTIGAGGQLDPRSHPRSGGSSG